MRHLWMAPLLAVAMTACSPAPKQSTRTELYDLIYVHDQARTLSFRVDLKNVETGEVALEVTVNRHCENKERERAKVGTRWELPVTTFTYPSGEVERKIHAHSLCQTQPVDPVPPAQGYQSIP